VKAILASGDLAAAQVVWTLEIRDSDGTLLATSIEPSLDIFRRQPDGGWKSSGLLRCARPASGPDLRKRDPTARRHCMPLDIYLWLACRLMAVYPDAGAELLISQEYT
jgi:hypothetical protein